MQRRLQQSQAWLASILSIAADAIIAIDDRHRIVLFNQGAETIFGYSAAEAVGQPLDMLLPARFRTGHSRHIERFAASGSPARRMGERRDIFGLRKDGSEFPADASISRVEIDGLQTFAVVLRDTSERVERENALRQSEERLRLANEQLEVRVAERTRQLEEEMRQRAVAQAALSRSQRLESLGQLTGGIAHDFNNLLTVITGNQELLAMRLSDAKDLTLLKRAQEAAEMGARLTARMLTFARRRRLEPVLIGLNEQVIGMVELLRRSIGEQVTLTTSLASDLWQVRADPSEIENAVLNLAINARDAMPGGGMLVIETANCRLDEGEIGGAKGLPSGNYVRISVSDTGTGMTPQVLARAFDPFFTTKETGKGTGLGLPTVYGFAELSGGTVTIYSEAGHGTTVNIYLPRAGNGNGKADQAAASASPPPAASGEQVLLVEDNAEVRSVTKARLEGLGYSVIEAADGRTAIAALEAGNRIDLVLSDVVMPGGMSGYDVAKWVADHTPAIRVLLTSGYPDEVALAAGPGLSRIKLLRKPYNRDELARAVREALD